MAERTLNTTALAGVQIPAARQHRWRSHSASRLLAVALGAIALASVAFGFGGGGAPGCRHTAPTGWPASFVGPLSSTLRGHAVTRRAAGSGQSGRINLNFVLVKKVETSTLHEIVDMPVDALQGLAGLGTAALNHRGVVTVRDLANWKYYKIAKAFVTLRAAAEETVEPSPDTVMNVNKALIKAWETKSSEEILAAPLSALQGLTTVDDENFKKARVTSIEQLGKWKFAHWAEAISDLAEYENLDGGSL